MKHALPHRVPFDPKPSIAPASGAMRVPEEIFDVVDEHDQVIGQERRSEVHRLGLRHRATHALIFNHRGEVFLQQRSLTKDMWPGVWDSSASGHLDQGETYDRCVVRELREELGLHITNPPPVWFRLPASPETGMEFCHVYHLAHEGPFDLQVSEVRGGAWFQPETLDVWINARPEAFASAFRLLWSMARNSAPPIA